MFFSMLLFDKMKKVRGVLFMKDDIKWITTAPIFSRNFLILFIKKGY